MPDHVGHSVGELQHLVVVVVLQELDVLQEFLLLFLFSFFVFFFLMKILHVLVEERESQRVSGFYLLILSNDDLNKVLVAPLMQPRNEPHLLLLHRHLDLGLEEIFELFQHLLGDVLVIGHEVDPSGLLDAPALEVLRLILVDVQGLRVVGAALRGLIV